jgi:phosphonoacetate hydrolase
MPTFTNPNNVSIVTGVCPAKHGICGNYFFDRKSGQAVMMDDPSFLWCDTIPSRLAAAGARVAIITAKEKLRRLLGIGLRDRCRSAEQEGIEPYSAKLSECVLSLGVELLRCESPDVLYLSTSDYIQHSHPPDSSEAHTFFAAVDTYLRIIDELGAVLLITADHGMSSKTDSMNRPRVIYLQDLLDDAFGPELATVILPITDPYVLHHGALGSFATVYLSDHARFINVAKLLSGVSGIERVLSRREASRLFELPWGRIGDIIVCADAGTVIGGRIRDHDLSALQHPLRSHGGLAEREVPMLLNRPWKSPSDSILMNYDAFSIALNQANLF